MTWKKGLSDFSKTEKRILLSSFIQLIMSACNWIDEFKDSAGDVQRLESIEKKYEQQFLAARKAVDSVQSDGKTTEDIKALQDNQDDLRFKLMLTAFVAENASDKRDEQMKKDLRLQDKTGQFLILGHHNSGKATLLNTIKDNPVAQYTSTVHANSEELTMGNIKFVTFNLDGGHIQGYTVTSFV
ncbi:unnamed protein product [Rotaria magnacalcarata]|uniref:small monomeric GTPase n=3 Tax=Rotaria magnacalcarata TaxID=392030 RepID=A0A8S2LSR9_9BILA|nr:unnamed protein product [Rotaria magnacalcarata]CAF3934861.1 unnamed protein product [Rotaria magnacalcarata]